MTDSSPPSLPIPEQPLNQLSNNFGNNNNNTQMPNSESNSTSAYADEGNNVQDGSVGAFHKGRPIPKQTAAGALLTGGFNSHKVYIGNLPDSATLADLEDCFGQLGQCTCSIKRGFGFVDYTEPAAAAEAVAKYHEGHFLGAQIKVELSHARASIPKASDDGKSNSRNPPGSDRPSDARKPMHINGPPAAGGRGGRQNSFNNRDAPRDNNRNFREPRGSQSDFPSRRNDDRYPSSNNRDMPLPFRGDAPYNNNNNDRSRDDYRDSRGPPPPPLTSYQQQDSRYPSGDFDRYSNNAPPRDLRGPPPPLGGYNNGPPPPLSRDIRDRPPYDPYYDSVLPPRAYGSGPPPLPPLSRGSGDFDRYSSSLPPPPFDSSLPPNLPPRNFNDSYDNSYDPRPSISGNSGREERNSNGGNPRYNPYGRDSSPREERNSFSNGRSPRGPPSNDRRRSLSPPPRPYRNNSNFPPNNAPQYPGPSFDNHRGSNDGSDNNGYGFSQPGGRGYGNRAGGQDEYNPRN